jgi:hypothetical protein
MAIGGYARREPSRTRFKQDSVKIASELALLIIFTLANTLLAMVSPTILSLFSNGNGGLDFVRPETGTGPRGIDL